MSVASERKAMRELLPQYALLGTAGVAAFLGCSEDVAREMIDDRTIPSVKVGKRRHVDPVDLVVHVLAEREGVTAEVYWSTHGEQTAELVRKYVARVRRLVAA